MMDSPRDENDELCSNYDDYEENPSELNESLSEDLVSSNTSLTVVCILFVTLFERLSYYGVAANLVFYCTDILNLSSPLSSSIVLAFQGTCFVTPIIGGWLGDTTAGRYNAVYGSLLAYVSGTALFTATTSKHSGAYVLRRLYQELFLAASLVLIAIAVGGVKANLSLMGADQVKGKGQKVVEKFFVWYYWFIQVGSLLAFTAVVYIQQNKSYFYGSLITVASVACGTIMVLMGRNHYIVHPPRSSALADARRIFALGIKNKLCRIKDPLWTHWLDGAKTTMGGAFSGEKVEAVKSMVRFSPIIFTCIFYWTIYSQGTTAFLLQGSYMNLKVINTFPFPAASLSIFEILCVLVLIPIIDRVVYPGLRRVGFNFTPLRRIGVGMLFAAGSVALAGLIEIERKRRFGRFSQDVFGVKKNASSMSVFYQVPQYILQGTSEALVPVSGLEFAYAQSPPELRGLVMGVCWAMVGVGYYVASLLVSIVKYASHATWYPDNLNKGTLEYYMFLLAGLMLIDLVVFLYLAVRYRYVDHGEGPGNDGHRAPGRARVVSLATAVPVNNDVYPQLLVR